MGQHLGTQSGWFIGRLCFRPVRAQLPLPMPKSSSMPALAPLHVEVLQHAAEHVWVFEWGERDKSIPFRPESARCATFNIYLFISLECFS